MCVYYVYIYMDICPAILVGASLAVEIIIYKGVNYLARGSYLISLALKSLEPH